MRKLLFDLQNAIQDSFAGIQGENRLLFNIFQNIPDIETNGLIWGDRQWHVQNLSSDEEQAIFMGFVNEPCAYNKPGMNYGFFSYFTSKLGNKFPRISRLNNKTRESFIVRNQIFPLTDSIPKNVVWRRAFSRTCDPKIRKFVEEANFYLSPLGLNRVYASLKYKLAFPKLDTEGFDFIFFEYPRAIVVDKKTTKIVRYHDAIPLVAPDTTDSIDTLKLHIRAVKACENDSIFVCNSPNSQNELRLISPIAASRSTVIPCVVPDTSSNSENMSVSEIVNKRRFNPNSGRIDLDLRKIEADLAKNHRKLIEDDEPYFIAVSTLEPRKNYATLLSAWSMFNTRNTKKVKLILVANPGWRSDVLKNEISRLSLEGDLIHLTKVPQEELNFLYSKAKAFISPSYAEGFGAPLIEAGLCGIPVIASDIDTYHYVLGESGIFFDPYSKEDLCQKMGFLMSRTPEQMKELSDKSKANALRFSNERVTEHWADFIKSI